MLKRLEMEGTRIPRTVDEVFNDFKGRRAGLIKALTTGIFVPFYLQLVRRELTSCLFIFKIYYLFIYLVCCALFFFFLRDVPLYAWISFL